MLELQTLAFNGRKSEAQSLCGWESDSVGLNHFVTDCTPCRKTCCWTSRYCHYGSYSQITDMQKKVYKLECPCSYKSMDRHEYRRATDKHEIVLKNMNALVHLLSCALFSLEYHT